MGAKKYPVRLRDKATVASDGTGEVKSDLVERGQVFACQSLAFRNRTGARGTVEFYIFHSDIETFICDEPAPAANEWYWYPYAQHLKEGERIIAKQASCLTSDVLDLHCIGYKMYGTEGGVE